MLVKVTKKMASLLNKNCPYDVSMQKLSERAFALSVGDPFNHETDYDFEDGTFKVIRVDYPDNYYAMPRFITTRTLQRLAKGCSTINDLAENFNDEVEI